MVSRLNKKKVFLFLLIGVLAILPFAAQSVYFSVTATNDLTEEEQQENTLIEEKMLNILDNPKLQGTITGVSVMDADTGELLYSRDGDVRLHPAFNQKFITAAAALEALGEDHTFSTEVLTDGDLRGPVLHGDLFLKGKGDPTLLKADLDQFAADLKDQGINKIKGDLVGDDTWYDDFRLPIDVEWTDESTFSQISALSLSPNEDYDVGKVTVEVTANESGDQAEVSLTPETDYVNIVNQTEMVPAGESKDISAERKHGTNDIIIEGTMPQDGDMSASQVTVWEPAGYAVDVFKKSLEKAGIDFIGNTGTQRLDATSDSASLLTAKESMPLAEMLIPFMKLNNNGHAETLTKEMGKVVHNSGNFDAGLNVMADVSANLGVDLSKAQIRDGSGIAQKNYIPTNELAALLYHAQDQSWFPAFEASLPVAGVDERLVGGTLHDRMTEAPAEGNVTGKGGSILAVSALSGYVTTLDGQDLIFSIMVNNHVEDNNTINSIENEIAHMLASHTFSEVTLPESISELKEIVEQYEEEGAFEDNATARAFTTHLISLEHFENEGQTEKVIQHLPSFKILLDANQDNMSQGAYEELSAGIDHLLEQWQ